jgi:stage V sporulation protein D (sporulation-specific penicillin-binding protein)
MIVGLTRASLSFFVFGVSMLEMLSNQSAIKKRRLSVLLCIFGILALYLLFTLFRLQIITHGAYEEKVIEQITVGSSLSAARGTIYDRNGNVLAANQTVYRIYISPIDIKKGIKREGIAYDEKIASGLAEILEISYDSVYKKTQKSAYLDQTVKRNVDEETIKAVLFFAKENGLSSMIHAEAGVRRYYPHGSLAAHVIGFAGSDGQGLFGLEAYYNDVLTGTDGKYMSAVDSQGIRLPLSYNDFIPARNGLDITTTLDIYVQTALEHALENAVIASDVKNRAAGIVMQVKTGDILAMATSPSFDLNDPYTLNEEYAKKLNETGLDIASTESEYRKVLGLFSYVDNLNFFALTLEINEIFGLGEEEILGGSNLVTILVCVSLPLFEGLMGVAYVRSVGVGDVKALLICNSREKLI